MDEIKCEYTNLIGINSLKPHPKNPNTHSKEQIERLAKIIEYQGQRSPVVVSKLSGYIVVGHGRLEAMKHLGWTKVAVDYQDFEDEAAEYAHMTADNAIGSWSELDLARINHDFTEFGPDLDIDMLGLKGFEIEPLDKLEPQSDEDEVPEVKDDPVTKKGDVWLLGNHRVMCGDSTMIDDVEKLMSGEKADMVFTDPPYGMNLDTDYSKMPTAPNGAKPLKHNKIKGDGEDFSEELINTIFTFDYVKEMFIFGADYFAELLPMKNEGSWVVWDKRVTENFDRMIGAAFELCWSKSKHKREIARFNNTLFSGESDAQNKVHPTQKPLKLIDWFFEKWCEGLNLCVDLYLGSGSTLIACEKTNRKCYGMELDEHYCDVIINRWQNYTGKEAILESTGKTYNETKENNQH